MKGGITSGIVYPSAICALARTYRLTEVIASISDSSEAEQSVAAFHLLPQDVVVAALLVSNSARRVPSPPGLLRNAFLPKAVRYIIQGQAGRKSENPDFKNFVLTGRSGLKKESHDGLPFSS
ncbi:MAG: hypothetical protein C5B51_31125 [Terriglobia bacterium]|nr:MAG: hypothetical protein C5B51_31125 [Terriglobia bacterium]